VGDVDRRDAEIALQPRDLGAHLHAQLRVQVGERLVHEEGARLADDRPAHGHPLALAAGKRARLLAQDVHQAQGARRLLHPAVDLLLGEAAHLEREGHVVVGRHVRVEGVVLEDHGDVAILRGQIVDHPAADADRARGHRLQPGDHAQRRRLAAAGRPHEDDKLAVSDLEVELGDRLRPVRIDLG